MPDIQSGFVTALYLFDVAQSIQLDTLKTQLGEQASAARLGDKTAGPPRLRYLQPPVMVDGQALGCGDLDGFKVRVKFYEYGVVSLMLSRPFAGSWPDLVVLGQTLIESDPLEEHATQACERIVARVHAALVDRRHTFLSEDYLIFAVTELATPMSADDMFNRHGADIAQLLRGERQPLSAQEREFVLKSRLSYLADDLLIPAWNAAWIYDTEAAALDAVEILELANSQLLEFRYHDDVLEAELARIYMELQRPRWTDRYARRRRTQAVLRVQSLFIDVNELTDRLENTVKFVGDPYAARLLSTVGSHLGLEHWKSSVEEKLKTLDAIRLFAVEQTGIAQANLLELVVVAILVIELGLFFAGLMK
jgi:hypothetical protein